MIQHYELLFIIPGSSDEASVPVVKEKVAELIKKNEGQITRDQDWERRKLAYKIKQEAYGYYWLIEFDGETKNIIEISRQLELMPEILRFLLVKARVKTAAELAEEVVIKEKIRARQTEEVKQEIKEADSKQQVEIKDKEVKKEEKIEGKVSMEDLDKKLNELLGDDLDV
ncbi:MAG: 30S ribosomal protein S6 [Patescibacteria group bacterium]